MFYLLHRHHFGFFLETLLPSLSSARARDVLAHVSLNTAYRAVVSSSVHICQQGQGHSFVCIFQQGQECTDTCGWTRHYVYVIS